MKIRPSTTLSAAALCSLYLVSSPASGQDPFYNHPVPRKNPINKTLIHDQAAVAAAIKAFNLLTFGSMSTRLPVCLAYVMDDEPLSEAFKEALAAIDKSLQASPKRLIARQAQRNPGADPVRHLMQINAHIKETLPKRMAGVPFEYHPMKGEEFRRAAICPGKETLLITAGEMQFYDRQLPPATLFSGKVPLDSLLFLILTDQATPLPGRDGGRSVRTSGDRDENGSPESPASPPSVSDDNPVEDSKLKRKQ